ncbi:MAG TPA: YciI family protein [Solirubrobacterales bacterium]|nr:YciI family protein [Solirubrobacterales bacterium]
MRYMLTLIGEESDWQNSSPEEMQEMMGAWSAFDRELTEAGALVAGEALQQSATATTIRIEGDGERVTTDGPFAETKEQVGGFYLLECADLDEALAWARKVPVQDGAVEVRAVVDLSAFSDQPAPTAESA